MITSSVIYLKASAHLNSDLLGPWGARFLHYSTECILLCLPEVSKTRIPRLENNEFKMNYHLSWRRRNAIYKNDTGYLFSDSDSRSSAICVLPSSYTAIPYFFGYDQQPINPQKIIGDWRNSGSRSWQQNPKPVHQRFVHDFVNAITACQTDISFVAG